MDVQKLRSEIPVLANLTYMNTGWSGPPPRRAAEAMKARTDLEMDRGPTTADVYESGGQIQAAARRAAARLLNAPLDSVLVTRNTTEGLNIVMSGLDWREGDEIITCNLEHGSVLSPSFHAGLRYGVKVNVVSLDPHDSWDTIVEKFEAAFTANTRMVFVSHIQYSTGLRMPAERLAALARERGALIMLDGAQTGGHIHLDMTESGFDFYSIPGQKWVLGYEGVGALYIRPGLTEKVHPAHTGGRAMLHTDDPTEFQPDTGSIEKFLGGSGSVPLQAAFVEAANFIDGSRHQEYRRTQPGPCRPVQGPTGGDVRSARNRPHGAPPVIGLGLFRRGRPQPRRRGRPPLGQPPDSHPPGRLPSRHPRLPPLFQYRGRG